MVLIKAEQWRAWGEIRNTNMTLLTEPVAVPLPNTGGGVDSVEGGSPGSDEVLAGFSCFSDVPLALLMALVLSLMGAGAGGGSGLVRLTSDSSLNPE